LAFSTAVAALNPRKRPRQHFLQSGLKLLSRRGPTPFLGVPNRGDSWGLLDHEEVFIDIADLQQLRARRFRQGVRIQVNDVARRQPPRRVDAEIPIDLHAAAEH
jgi:hypothetical protein